MEIRHYRRIEWNDLPGIETPVFTCAAIGDRFTGMFSRDARRIRGLDEALEKYRFSQGRLYPLEDEREECLWLLRSVDEGEFVLVFGMRHDLDHPMSPVLRWSTERHPEGMRPPMRGYLSPWPGGIPPDGRWIADPRLPWGLRRRIEACLEEGRRDEALHRGVPEKFWWGLLLQGYQRRGGGGDGGHDSTLVKRAVGRGGEDRVVSLDEPDPGFMKAGLFGPSPPRMSDKAFEANMCEWACQCKDAYGRDGTHQGCVDMRIRAQYYDSTNHPRDDSPVWSEVSYYKEDSVMSTGGIFGGSAPVHEKYDMVESREYPGKPSSWYPRDGTWRPDIVKVGPDGKPEKFYDMKLPGDEPKEEDADWKRRKAAYEAIAKKHTGSIRNYKTFIVKDECGDCQKQKQEQRQPEQATQGESKSLGQQFRDWDRLPEKPPVGPDGPKPKPPSLPPLPLPGLPIPI